MRKEYYTKIISNLSNKLESLSEHSIQWIGSVKSLIIHTILFSSAFLLYFCGETIDKILLAFTYFVSIEAIYLAIFIQMSVNLQSKKLHNVAQEVEDIQEDVEDIQEDVEDIQEDVEELQKDDESDDSDKILLNIERTMKMLMKEVVELKKQQIRKK